MQIQIPRFTKAWNDEFMQLARNLAKLMKEQKLSLAQLANLSGVPKPTLHGWTTGRRAMNPEQIKKVAAALKVPVYRLLFGETDPYESSSDDILKEIFRGDVRVTIHRIERLKRN